MGHRPCQNRLYMVYKVYGGCKLCEGRIKEEDLLIINFTELMAFRENDFASLNEENVPVVSKLIFTLTLQFSFRSLFELYNFAEIVILGEFFHSHWTRGRYIQRCKKISFSTKIILHYRYEYHYMPHTFIDCKKLTIIVFGFNIQKSYQIISKPLNGCRVMVRGTWNFIGIFELHIFIRLFLQFRIKVIYELSSVGNRELIFQLRLASCKHTHHTTKRSN